MAVSPPWLFLVSATSSANTGTSVSKNRVGSALWESAGYLTSSLKRPSTVVPGGSAVGSPTRSTARLTSRAVPGVATPIFTAIVAS